MIKLNGPDSVLFAPYILGVVGQFYKIHSSTEVLIDENWTLIFRSLDNPKKFIYIADGDWTPEFGDFYKTEEQPDGCSEDEQETPG